MTASFTEVRCQRICLHDRIMEWRADKLFTIGGFFRARLSFPKEYPHLPPKMKFLTKLWHPNGKLALCIITSCRIHSLTSYSQSTQTVTYAYLFYTLQAKTAWAMSTPLSAGHRFKHPHPFYSLSSVCSAVRTPTAQQTSTQPNNFAKTQSCSSGMRENA